MHTGFTLLSEVVDFRFPLEVAQMLNERAQAQHAQQQQFLAFPPWATAAAPQGVSASIPPPLSDVHFIG